MTFITTTLIGLTLALYAQSPELAIITPIAAALIQKRNNEIALIKGKKQWL